MEVLSSRLNGDGFTDEQKSYLQGFWSGFEAVRSRQSGPTWSATLGLPESVSNNRPSAEPPAIVGSCAGGARRPSGAEEGEAAARRPAWGRSSSPTSKETQSLSNSCSGSESAHRTAQDRFLAQGKKLSPEEECKRKQDPLDAWDDLSAHAAEGKFPKGLDVFRFKFHGLFYVAPAQDAFMCRLRLPAGILQSHQLRGIARIAEELAGGYADVTTRANLQLREIKAENGIRVLTALHELGIVPRGAGADNIRNITASPTAGIDPVELIDTRPFAKELHHTILHHRELYGLPRKFNVAFDGGGRISVLEDTNDIGFAAVRVGAGKSAPAGVYFRVLLGGITGHLDFARDTGLLLEPSQCLPLALAMVRVFIEHGDRTDRKKARLKYLLDRWGHERFVEESLARAKLSPRRLALEDCEPRAPVSKHGHIGVHEQKQPGYRYIGVVLPVGRMTYAQMRGLAAIAERCGSGTLRLTVWQNLLISDVHEAHVQTVLEELHTIGLSAKASGIRGGLVACTGSKGCKYAASDTKGHALELASYLEDRLQLDHPINIHFTGCPHSCAQHTIGDIGLLGTKVPVGEDVVEGYHVYLGGGYGADQKIAREVYRDVPAAALPMRIERMLRGYLECRRDAGETFLELTRRKTIPELLEIFDRQEVPA